MSTRGRLEILRLAVATLGQQSDFNTPQEAGSINDFYDNVYDNELVNGRYEFATRDAILTRVGTHGNEKERYQLPADFLHFMASNVSGAVIDSEYIVGNDSSRKYVKLRYIARVKENYLPPFFIKLVAMKLAMETAVLITNDINKYRVAEIFYKSALYNAKQNASTITERSFYKNNNFLSRR